MEASHASCFAHMLGLLRIKKTQVSQPAPKPAKILGEKIVNDDWQPFLVGCWMVLARVVRPGFLEAAPQTGWFKKGVKQNRFRGQKQHHQGSPLPIVGCFHAFGWATHASKGLSAPTRGGATRRCLERRHGPPPGVDSGSFRVQAWIRLALILGETSMSILSRDPSF